VVKNKNCGQIAVKFHLLHVTISLINKWRYSMTSLATLRGKDKYKGIYINETNQGKTYYIKYRNEHGKTVRKSLKHIENIKDSDALSALNEAKLNVIKLKKGLPTKEKKKINALKTLNEMADYYFLNNDFRSKKGEMQRYNRHCREEEFATKLFELITIDELEDFKEELEKKKPTNINDVTSKKTLAPKSIKNIFALCISIVKYAIKKRKYKGDNPFIDVEKPVVDNVRLKEMSEVEIELYFDKLKTADTRSPKYQVSYLYGILALTTGAREQTILNIKLDDINFEDNIINLYNFKSKVAYLGHIVSEDVTKAIKNVMRTWEHQSIENDNEYLFRHLGSGNRYKKAPAGVRNTLNKYINKDRTDEKIITVRDLRNVFATRLINLGMPLSHIQNLLSHKSPEITQRYARLLKKTGGDELKEMFKSVKI
jgi:site-specific recombinase XerD